MESLLFGHEKGAFTTAVNPHQGFFEQANNGTIFFDNFQYAPALVQESLLRVIEDKKIKKVGGTEEIEVDVVIIFATSVPILTLFQNGEIIPDLYYRLESRTIFVPPLRERKEDIPELVEYFQRNFVESKLIPPGSQLLDQDEIVALQNHDWPGNVRQIKNFLETMAEEFKEQNQTPLIPTNRLQLGLKKIYSKQKQEENLTSHRLLETRMLPKLAKALKFFFNGNSLLSEGNYTAIASGIGVTVKGWGGQKSKLISWRWLQKSRGGKYTKGVFFGDYALFNTVCTGCSKEMKRNNFSILAKEPEIQLASTEGSIDFTFRNLVENSIKDEKWDCPSCIRKSQKKTMSFVKNSLTICLESEDEDHSVEELHSEF